MQGFTRQVLFVTTDLGRRLAWIMTLHLYLFSSYHYTRLNSQWNSPKKVPLDVNNGNVLNYLFAFVNYEQCSSLHNTFNHLRHSPCHRTPLWYFPWNLHWDAEEVQLVFVVNGTMQLYYLLNKTATWHANENRLPYVFNLNSSFHGFMGS